MTSVLWAAAGTGFTFLLTSLGAATVFLFRRSVNDTLNRVFLGFAGGVMIAASVWSLLIPAMEEAKSLEQMPLVPAVGGFLLGVGFIWLLDSVIPHLHPGANEPEGQKSKMKRENLLLLAVTLHNIPEGMAVGLSFARAAQHGADPALLTAAMALAVGIGIQNFPEGAAVALPLKREGASSFKAFLVGSASAIVEPIFGIAAVVLAGAVAPLMPYLLSFAAGAMMYVVAEELIPQANEGDHSNAGTMGVMAGFLLMMILDVALG